MQTPKEQQQLRQLDIQKPASTLGLMIITYKVSLMSIKTISALFPRRNLENIFHFVAWSAIPKSPWGIQLTSQVTNQPPFISLFFFSHNSRGIQAVDKEGPVPERSSFSFNERAWEAWDPWAGASVSEPAVLPPLRPPLNLTFQILQFLRRTEGNVDLWD